MKNIILLITTSLITAITIAGVPESSITANQNIEYAKTTVIDALDTVVFDLSKATLVGNKLSFPVSILSDDTVNALDFSFKYNHAKLIYDSITDLTTYMQPLAFYNSNDSTVRFTSNSFQRYQNDTALLTIHFTVLSGQFAATDLNTPKAYLNGNVCTLSLSNLISTGIHAAKTMATQILVFPNPTTGEFQITGLPAAYELSISNEMGELILNEKINQEILNILPESIHLKSGIYFLKVEGKKFSETKKIVVNR